MAELTYRDAVARGIAQEMERDPKDGLIDDPRRCDFKPARDLPHCAEGTDQADCFTADQIAALERIHGDVMSQGKRFFPGWPVGAEIAGPNGQSGWIGQEINGPNGPGAWTSYGQNFLRFVVPGAKADPWTAIQCGPSAVSISTRIRRGWRSCSRLWMRRTRIFRRSGGAAESC